MQGTIRTIQAERGFGFILDANGGEVFFHRSAVIPPERFASLKVGMAVAFEPESGPKGPRATNITIAAETRR